MIDILRKNPIVDTGPLFDFLIWKFSETKKLEYLIKKLKYLHFKHRRIAVDWYLNFAKPILISPEVIAEINRHAQSVADLSKPQMEIFWAFSQSELRHLGIDEEMIKLLDMKTEILKKFGPTDTALFHLAQRPENIGKPVFTQDGKLRALCKTNEIHVLDVGEVLSLWQSTGSKL